MIKIAICDDDREYCKNLKQLCQEILQSRNIQYRIELFFNGDDLLKSREDFHGIFLDVEMEGKDGITVKDILEQRYNEASIVFITIHTEVMPEAFGNHVCGFLEKPVKRSTFEKMFDKIMTRYSNHYMIKIMENGGEQLLLSDKVLYVKAEHIYADIHTIDGNIYSSRTSLNEWERELIDHGFYRIHKSYLINMGNIKIIRARDVEMQNGVKIKISRNCLKEFHEVYRVFRKKEARYL